MCPLRLLLIFLSASLAGFFVLRNLRSQPHHDHDHGNSDDASSSTQSSDSPIPIFSKVRVAIESGFWTFVDMASGRYLWSHLTSTSKSKQST
ncbi:uncharacterized protein LOC129303506 [Prosopis cineraria]|uniref:uncharacterized protein LOC129303506 n=1 Tax=Prosopis cineraria TaxID=364024 RepID=UPI00240FB3D8|nr:uncharacterized protein LOC129303506 [Prosopis cineraria]